MTSASKAPCPMCGGPRDSEVYVCPKCRYVPVSFSMPTIMQNQFDDAYWIRVFAGHALQACLSNPRNMLSDDVMVHTCVLLSQELLEEIKKREAEKK